MRGQEVLSKGHGDGRDDPRDLLHLEPAILDGRDDLGRRSCSRNDGHGGNVDCMTVTK